VEETKASTESSLQKLKDENQTLQLKLVSNVQEWFGQQQFMSLLLPHMRL